MTWCPCRAQASPEAVHALEGTGKVVPTRTGLAAQPEAPRTARIDATDHKSNRAASDPLPRKGT